MKVSDEELNDLREWASNFGEMGQSVKRALAELLAIRKVADAASAWDDATTLPVGKAAWDALREALKAAGR